MRKKQILLAVLSVVGLTAIVLGTSLALFNYIKYGTTENVVSTGTIEFLYTEVDKIGSGIKIEDALPMTDEQGKIQTGSGNVFNFKVTSKVIGKLDIPYEVTARMKSDSDLDGDVVKVYLTEVDGGIEKELLLNNYSKLTQTSKVEETKYVEKTIYTGTVPTGSIDYEKEFRLRMWLDNDMDSSDEKYNGKTFTITVNVYANAKTVTTSEIDMANTTKINQITVNNNIATETSDSNYDYEISVDKSTTEVNIDVETVNSEAKVEVTKLNNETVLNNNIRRLSTLKTVTLPLTDGDNIFNIKVISANKKVINEYTLKINKRQYSLDNKSYVEGEEIEWIGQNWYVLKDNGKSVDLILKSNYDKGNYGTTTDFSTSTAYTKLNTDFINSNSTLKEAIDEGTVTYNSNTSSYIRLPYSSELSTNIPNDSSTAFWTMSSSDNKLYLGNSTGEKMAEYMATETGTYYSDYSTVLANIQKTGAKAVEKSDVLISPNQTSITYNSKAEASKHSATYGSQTTSTKTTPYAYPCGTYGSACPNTYCNSNSRAYYTNSCSTSNFTYYTPASYLYGGTTTVTADVCSSSTIYYANGNCQDFYDMVTSTLEIGYRPVVNVLKK